MSPVRVQFILCLVLNVSLGSPSPRPFLLSYRGRYLTHCALFLAAIQTMAFFCVPLKVCAANAVHVTVEPFVVRPRVIFDSTKDPGASAGSTPGDLPGPPVDAKGRPLIDPGKESATAAYAVEVEYSFQMAPDGTIASVNVTVRGTSTVYLPKTAKQELREHEDGHTELGRDAYDREAKKLAEEAFKDYVGTKKYPDAASAQAEGDRRADRVERGLVGRAELFSGGAIQVIQDKYDALTNHGRNPNMTAAQGIQAAKDERDLIERQIEEVFYIPPDPYHSNLLSR
jgi:hypothetical protein